MTKYTLIPLGALICFTTGYFSHHVIEETKLTSEVVDTHKQQDLHERTVTVITEHPDGTKLTTISKETESLTQTEAHKVNVQSDQTSSLRSQWTVGLYKSQDAYISTINRRVLGPLLVGVYIRQQSSGWMPSLTQPELGIGIQFQF